MMSNENQNNERLPIDNDKLDRMKIKIIKLEKENLATNTKSRTQMLEEIKKIIIDEESKCY